MRKTRFVAGVVAGVTTLTVIAGCAGQQIQALEPKLELRDAAKALGDAQQAGFTLKLTGSADELVAAMKLQAGKDKSGAPDADDTATVKQLFNSSFTMAYDKVGAGEDDDRAQLGVTVDGVSGTEIRYVDGKLYLRAPVAELATKFGGSAEDVKAARAELAGEVKGLDTLLDGKWVSVDGKEISDLAAAGTGTVGQAEKLEQQKALAEFATSATNLLEGAAIVRDAADESHLIVTSSTTKGYAELQRLIKALGQPLAESLPAEAPKDRPIVLDLWVEDSKLTAVEVDILQFIDGAAGRVAARIEVTTGAPITAPEGATAIDTKALAESGAGLSATGVPGSSAAELSAPSDKELQELLDSLPTPAATR